ncbi:hypothetical protein [uncultured Roseobacter sp.]|uniref:hypothetical protein n=1 Tax=uncultured Roseobacter sp. TaxID=114847 RepID=UPI002612BF6A|nr:hypothetical protein [uncultured Roseobacter sp.]
MTSDTSFQPSDMDAQTFGSPIGQIFWQMTISEAHSHLPICEFEQRVSTLLLRTMV